MKVCPSCQGQALDDTKQCRCGYDFSNPSPVQSPAVQQTGVGPACSAGANSKSSVWKILLGLLCGPVLCYAIFVAIFLFGVFVQGLFDKTADAIGMQQKEATTSWGTLLITAVVFGGVAINLAVLIVKRRATRAIVGLWLGLPATWFAVSGRNASAIGHHQEPYGGAEIAVFSIVIIVVVSFWAAMWDTIGTAKPSGAEAVAPVEK